MGRYAIMRTLQGLLTMFAVLALVFFLGRMTGSPVDVLLSPMATQEEVDALTAQLGLDKPMIVQFGIFIGDMFQGKFGESISYAGRSSLELVFRRFPATFQLAAGALLIGLAIALPMGIFSAVKRGTMLDKLGKTLAIGGQSVPIFWLGIMLIWIFSVKLGLLPTSGRGGITHMILPSFTLGWAVVPGILRLLRSSMLDALGSEYVKLARSKGLSQRTVIFKHCLKNAAITPLTYFGMIVAFLLMGTVVTETVFAWPGVGLLALEATLGRDFPVVQTIVFFVAGIFVFSTLVVDLLYAYIDPRVRYH